MFRRLSPRPPRLERRGPPRTRSAHLGHDLARGGPDEHLRLDLGDLGRDANVHPRSLRAPRSGDRAMHRFRGPGLHRAGRGRGPHGRVSPGGSLQSDVRQRRRGDRPRRDQEALPPGQGGRYPGGLLFAEGRAGQSRGRHHGLGQGRAAEGCDDRPGRFGHGRHHAQRPCHGRDHHRGRRSRRSSWSIVPACGPGNSVPATA